MKRRKRSGKNRGGGSENGRENAGFCAKYHPENMYKKRTKSEQNETDF